MAGNLNGLGLILVILLTGVNLARYGRWPALPWHIVQGISTGSAVMVVVSCLTLVLDREANNSHQLLIPTACLALLLVFTNANSLRGIPVYAIILSMLIWSWQVIYLIGPQGSYTGDPAWTERSCRGVMRSHLRVMARALSAVAQDDGRSYPAGWFTESSLERLMTAREMPCTRSQAVEIRSFWHTPLTGLYGKSYRELSLWYPGGRLKEGAQRLEFKTKPR